MRPNYTHRLSSVLIAFCFLFITQNAFALGAKRPATGGGSTTPSVPPSPPPVAPPVIEDGSSETIAEKYSYVDQEKIVPASLLLKTLVYYDANLSKIKNKNYIVVIDFKQHNSKKRFYLINMQSGDVEPYLTAHGRNSDTDFDGYATKFSNTSGSKMSSVGFYLTAETYYGDNGYSLRLDGLSATNSNARSRAIVIHGASYVREVALIGRSYGCPALEVRYAADIINTIKGGVLIYADG